MDETPNYYAILTADVRYDNNLSDREKILFAEITALCNKTGECWASNEYFANLYDVSESSIKRSISNLEKEGYINRKLIYKEDSKEIEKRIVTLGSKMTPPWVQICTHPGSKNDLDNNTSINNTRLIKEELKIPEGFEQIINDWFEYKISKKQGYKNDKSKQICINQLAKMSNNKPLIAKEIVEKSIMNNYQGLFPLRPFEMDRINKTVIKELEDEEPPRIKYYNAR